MGTKRIFHDEEFPGFPYKQAKQLDSTSFHGKEFDRSEKDAESKTVFCSSLFPEYFEFIYPQKSHHRFEDGYPSLLDRTRRKQVPIGPNHQADIPVWTSRVTKERNIVFKDHSDEKLTGMEECNCSDGGSIRCVRQHIKAARERLKKTLGHEKFVELGFYDMGEEVARKWTEEEECIFLEVVKLGKNFWEQLSVIFPDRTQKDLVSYYFNVFILRRRAAQNRSRFLHIDSDDDEWHGEDDDDDEESDIESDDYHEVDLSDNEDLVYNRKNNTLNEDFDLVQGDSCTSFEFQTNMGGSSGGDPNGSKTSMKCLHGTDDDDRKMDARAWGDRFAADLLKDFDSN